MKRLRVLLTLAIAFAAMAPSARADTNHYFGTSPFCDTDRAGRGKAVSADGPASQVEIQTGVFASAYARACRAGSGAVSYLGSGDRAGIDAIEVHDDSIQLSTSDVPLSTDEKLIAEQDLVKEFGRSAGLHQIPLYVDVLGVGYNLPKKCNTPSVRLRAPLLSLIFAGQVAAWNDQKLLVDNPTLQSCDVPIRLVKRVDFSGSTQTFKDYLSRRNPAWDYYKLPEHNQEWPSATSACNALGPGGVADCVRSLEGSIGYLPLHVARLAGVKTAWLDNSVSEAPAAASSAGAYGKRGDGFYPATTAQCGTVAADLALPPSVQPVRPIPTVELSNGYAPTRLDWSLLSLTDSPNGYPLCTISFALMFDRIQSAYFTYSEQQGRTVVDYLWTALTDTTQAKLKAFDVVPLPGALLQAARDGVSAIRYKSSGS